MIECIAYSYFDGHSPVGLLFDELQSKVLVSSNDDLFFFDIQQIIQFNQELDDNNYVSQNTPFSTLKKKIYFNKYEKLGGNVRSIRKAKHIQNNYINQLKNYFALNIKNYPVKVCDFDGKIHHTIYLKNELDEIDNLYSLDFIISENLDKYIILGGGKNCIYFNDLVNSEDSIRIKLKSNKGDNGFVQHQKGIISALSLKTKGIGSLSIFASGTFSNTIFIHDLKDRNSQVNLFDKYSRINGVTELYWLENNNYSCDKNCFIDYHLISGHRNNSHFFIWDVRKPNQILFKVERNNFGTHQRFSINYYIDHELNNQLLLTYGDSKGYLYMNKLHFNYNNYQFNQVNNLSKFKLEKQSLPFVEYIDHQNLILTLSGERNCNDIQKEMCSFKIWKYRI